MNPSESVTRQMVTPKVQGKTIVSIGDKASVHSLEEINNSITSHMEKLGKVVPEHPDAKMAERIGKGLGKGILLGAAGFTIAFGWAALKLLEGKEDKSFLVCLVALVLVGSGIVLDVLTWVAAWPARLMIMAVFAAAGLILTAITAYAAQKMIMDLHANKSFSPQQLTEKMQECTQELEALKRITEQLSNKEFKETQAKKMGARDKASLVFMTNHGISQPLGKVKDNFNWQFNHMLEQSKFSKDEKNKFKKERDVFLRNFEKLEKEIVKNFNDFIAPERAKKIGFGFLCIIFPPALLAHPNIRPLLPKRIKKDLFSE